MQVQHTSKNIFAGVIFFLALLVFCPAVSAETAQSSNYVLEEATISSGSDPAGSSANYYIEATLGEPWTGSLSGGNYDGEVGYNRNTVSPAGSGAGAGSGSTYSPPNMMGSGGGAAAAAESSDFYTSNVDYTEPPFTDETVDEVSPGNESPDGEIIDGTDENLSDNTSENGSSIINKASNTSFDTAGPLRTALSNFFGSGTIKKVVPDFIEKIDMNSPEVIRPAEIVSVVALAPSFLGAISGLFAQPLTQVPLRFFPARFISVILSALGLRKKKKPWGTVYDSLTKEPLDPAYVTIKNQAGEEVVSSMTDIDGRYGFLVPPGQYTIEVGKSDYIFPSEKLKGRISDEIYKDLYFGGVFNVLPNEAVTMNIPMDQENFSWNEFAKNEQKLMTFYSGQSLLISRIWSVLFILGFIVSTTILLAAPSIFHALIFGLYLAMFVFKFLGIKPKSFGVVSDQNGKPLSYGVVRVYFSNSSDEVMHKVLDLYGRYHVLVSPGNYRLEIDRKNPDGSYSHAYSSEPFHAKKGIIRHNIQI